MMLIGLTGGVATGKSTVAKMFGRCGAVVIDADQLAREVVRPGKPAWRDIIHAFGTGVLNPDRTINRRVLGSIVFSHSGKRRRLERIIHPRVAREQQRLTRLAAKTDPDAVVLYDVPLLFEAGIDARVDTIIVVTADRETQIARLGKRNGLSRSEALRRIRSQMPMKRKCRLADFLLDGTKDTRRLKQDVAKIYEGFRSL
ncbi:MAG: dephospho-CoA kinase [Nitrospira sp.]|nr:dephospho-CoA kinase [Nitrospira sp.]